MRHINTSRWSARWTRAPAAAAAATTAKNLSYHFLLYKCNRLPPLGLILCCVCVKRTLLNYWELSEREKSVGGSPQLQTCASKNVCKKDIRDVEKSPDESLSKGRGEEEDFVCLCYLPLYTLCSPLVKGWQILHRTLPSKRALNDFLSLSLSNLIIMRPSRLL